MSVEQYTEMTTTVMTKASAIGRRYQLFQPGFVAEVVLLEGTVVAAVPDTIPE